MLELLLLILLCLAIGSLLLNSGVIAARQRERRRSRLLAERLIAESHLEHLTIQTLQAMRQAARERLRSQRPIRGEHRP